MADEKLEILIELLKTGQGGQQAAAELEAVDKKAKATGASLATLSREAKAAFAALGGVALLRSALNEFIESEKAIARLNSVLRSTGQFSAQTSKELQALAKSFQDVTTFSDEAALTVISKLLAFGAPRESVARLTEVVLDLSTVLDKDLPRATLAMGKALKGEFGAFTELGFKIDDTKSATEQFNQVLEQLATFSGGAARGAAASLGGQMDVLKNQISEVKETMGSWIAAGISGITALAQAGGKLLALPATAQAQHGLGKSNDALRAALEKEIAAGVASGEIGPTTAGLARSSLESGFARIKRQVPTMTEMGGTVEVNERNFEGERAALQIVADLVRPGLLGNRPSVAAPGPITSPGLSAEDLRRQDALGIQMWEDALAAQREFDAEQQRISDDTLRRISDEDRARRASLEAERGLQNDLTLASLSGLDREMAQARINHEERVAQIMELGAEDEARVGRLLSLEEQLYQTELRNLQKKNQDLIQLGENAKVLFASGLSHAIVSAFEEGDKAFQKFASNFLKQMADMILQALILRAIQGALGARFGGGGGFAGAQFAGGGQAPRLAAAGLTGVSELNAPTFFPGFNVLAGEAGREVMTVLAKPQMMNFGGLAAQVGNVGNSKLAIVNAYGLAARARKFADGGMAGDGFSGFSGGGGPTEVMIRLEKGLRAEIVKESVDSATVKFVNDLRTDSAASAAVKRLNT